MLVGLELFMADFVHASLMGWDWLLNTLSMVTGLVIHEASLACLVLEFQLVVGLLSCSEVLTNGGDVDLGFFGVRDSPVNVSNSIILLVSSS